MRSNQKPTKPFLAGLLASAATLATAGAQTVTVYQTNGDGSVLLANQPSVSFGSSGGSTTITVNPNTKFQQMDGFGASMTDSSASLIYNKLSASQQSALMKWFFSTSGIGLNWLRQPMGASDFTAQGNFSYDDMPSGQTDVNLNNFSIAKDLTYTIPVLKQAFAVNPNIKVQLLPWSPPAWMKTSGTMNGGNFNDSYYSSLAQYFVKSVQAYQAQGIPVYAVSAQNEPEYSTGSYPSESFSSSEEAAFIGGSLAPAFSSAGLSPKILGYEHNWNDPSYPEAVLSNSAAYNAVAGTSWHCYSDVSGITNQTAVQNAYPNKGQWFTECSGSTTGAFGSDLAWGLEHLIIGSTRNWAKSVSEWNLALDQNSNPTNGGCNNCRGFVTINTGVSPATVTYNVENYIYGHAAKFVVPGAYRVDSNSAAAQTGGIEDVAFLNPDGSMVVIVFNDASSSTKFNVNYSPNNTTFAYTLPAQSVATFTWMPGSTGTTTTVPAAPSSLTATAASSSQINLSWTASSTSGATYNAYRSTTSGFAPAAGNLVTSGVTGTTYSDTGLAASTAYYYLVQAVNSAGSSASSNQASATTSAAAAGGTVSTTAYYQIVNKASGSCVDLTGGNTGNGTVLQQWACGAGNLNQQWKFTPASGSYYEVTPHASSTVAWDVVNVGTTPGTNMQLWTYGGGLNQQFQPVLQSSGYYEFIDHNSGLCLNVPGGVTTNGQQLQINTCNGSTSEAFTLNQQ